MTGCNPRYAAYLAERGQTGRGAFIQTTGGQAYRILDDTSFASITVPAFTRCCRQLDRIDPLSHELSVWDLDDPTVPLWAGPIMDITDDGDSILVSAKDLSWHFDVRVAHNDLAWTDEDLGQVCADIVNDALFDGPWPDNPGITIDIDPIGVLYSGQVLARVRQTAGQTLRSISDRGLDWSMVGRTLFVRPHTSTPRPYRIMGRDFMQQPKIRRSGDDYVDSAYVVGSGGATGAAFNFDPRFGLVERVQADPTITTTFDADALADAWISEANGVGPYIDLSTLTTLSPRSGLSLSDDLIPGYVFEVVLTDGCPPVAQALRLVQVVLKWDDDGGSIQVGFTPTSGTESAFVEASQS
jgi:hypothetical protein